MLTREQALTQLTGPGGAFQLSVDAPDGSGPMRVYAAGPKTLRELLIASRDFGDREFLIYEDERLTYLDHYHEVARLAAWLSAQGVGHGDRVGICMRNYPEWSVAFFACQALGAVAVTLNAWWTADELAYGISDSGCSVAVLDHERYERLLPSLSEPQALDRLPSPNNQRALDKLRGLQLLVVRDPDRVYDVAHWEDAIAAHSDVSELPPATVDPLDIATVMYTSGTTGFPKGALHTHRNHTTNIQNTLLAGAVARAQLPDNLAVEPPIPCALQTFPLFHIGGLSGLYISLATGGKLVLMYRWDVEEALALIQRERVISWSAVPTLVRQMLEHPAATDAALDSVVGIASGGAPVPADLINQIGAQFQSRVAPGNGYGATETTSAIIVNGGADYLARPQSVGRPVVTVDVRVVDEQAQDCEVRSVGELWVRGSNIFAGYWNRPEETAAAFSDGWFRTGDLGYVDDEGFYFVVDRIKDVVIRGGENVYCAEVEGVLHEHPQIVDVALIGLPHRVLGEEVAAVVETAPGAVLSEAEVQACVAARLARFNVPTKIFFTDEPLPRTASGKILKRELKQRYGETVS